MVFASLLSLLLPLKYKDDESKDFANLLDDCVFSAENSVWHVIGMESFLLSFLKKEDIVVKSLSHVRLFLTPWTAAHQAPLFFTIFQSLLKPMSIESVMPSNHLILCGPLLLPPSVFPSIRVFSNESFFASGGQSIGASASFSPSNDYSELIESKNHNLVTCQSQPQMKSGT